MSDRVCDVARPRSQSGEPCSGAGDLHLVLRRLFGALERRGLQWTLLRIPSNPAAPTGDVDVLVAPADADALREVAVELGFVALPGWESAPDLILVCYDRPSDHWVLLDVSTDLSFRLRSSWRLPGAAEEVLRRRRLQDGMAVPADDDAFWLLLLHCLLDKGRVTSHHRAQLRRLAAAGPESRLGPAVCAAAGVGFTPAGFEDAARSGEWEALTELGARLAAALKRRRSVPERSRVLKSEILRVARKPLLVPRRRGLNLALLGPNGVGKSTAAEGLARCFPFESRVIYMGIWKAADGTRGRALSVAEILARPFRIWSRYLLAQYHQLRGRLVIFDRYVYEARLPARPPLLALKRPYFWLLANALPAATAAVVLDVPGHVAYGRKQENPPDELESERRIYAQLTGRVRSLELVDAGADADTVRAEITSIVWRELAARWQEARVRS